MNGQRRPRIARWLLQHFTSSPNVEAIVGDLDERYAHRRSRIWYWQQVAVAIVVTTLKDIWTHKLLALSTPIVGWYTFWALFGALFDDVQAAFYLIPWLDGHLYYFKAFCTLGVCTIGVLTGGFVWLLHRRKMSMVQLFGTFFLVYWSVLGFTKHPGWRLGVSPSYFWMNLAILTLGILAGGVLCESHRDTTPQHSVPS